MLWTPSCNMAAYIYDTYSLDFMESNINYGSYLSHMYNRRTLEDVYTGTGF
jgi:hypothetical protein